MPEYIDPQAQLRRKQEALRSAVAATAAQICFAPLLIWLGWSHQEDGLLAWVFLVVGVVSLGMILPIWKSYQTRIKEIEGGEEDAAAQY